ncbi:predicted GPI-anchored protein 58 [Miscanthus floridulus]|uniref:predicted GPI-anchored protein 58 n=1 Tax=Miscanthus floridulus TaxID=154761 RepID=UPI00345783EF
MAAGAPTGHRETKAPPRARDTRAASTRSHRSLICPALATGGPACAASPPASTVEPPTAVANALEDLDHHLDLRIMTAMTRGSFPPPQLDTSTATEAHRALAADGSTAAEENRGTPPRRPPMRELGAQTKTPVAPSLPPSDRDPCGSEERRRRRFDKSSSKASLATAAALTSPATSDPVTTPSAAISPTAEAPMAAPPAAMPEVPVAAPAPAPEAKPSDAPATALAR